MKARNKTIFIIIAFACLPLITAAILCIFAFALPAQYSETFLGEMRDKTELLGEAKGKRIIVIGGSSVAFGQDSELIEKYLPEYSVVNFGLYGDLGTKIMLDVAERDLRDGDIVIISPEQDEQTLSLFFSGENFWQAADGNFGILSRVKRENIGEVVGAMPEFAAKKAAYSINGAPRPDDIYRKDSFNAHGDIKSGLRPHNTMRRGYDVTRPVRFDVDVIGEGFTEYLNGFSDKAKKRGATVYYRICPINRRALQSGSADEFYDYLDEKLNFDILGDPNNSVIDWRYFYDSNFHLNDSGVTVNTRNLIRDIKAALADDSPTDITVPAPPVPPAADITGDNDDAEMFTYTLEDGCQTVTGLTDEGKLRERLTIPAEYDGLPVAGFSKTAFAGAINLKELTLQENISVIEDKSFEDCPALIRLILLHDAPNKCMAGNDLFGSATFNVYVPSELVQSYRVNYFWAQYGARIRPLTRSFAYA